MRLLPRVHLVGSGAAGFGLTDRYDCHVYLVDGGDAAALVDAGIGAGADAIVANAEAAGVARERIRHLVLTHAHPDHSGGAASLRERLPWLEVAASPAVAHWVRTGDEEAMSVAAGKRSDFYPPDFRFTPSPIERELAEGDAVAVGDLVLEAIETAGHADGHLAFRLDSEERVALFSGDLVFLGGRISLENTWDCRIQAYAASMAKLAGAGIDALLPGHHSLTVTGGQEHLDTASRLFERGFVPRSIV